VARRVEADARAAANRLVADLLALGDPERATGQAAYLKSDLEFVGVKVPEVRRAVRALLRAERLDRPRLIALTDALWAQRYDSIPIYECRLAAVEVLHASPKVLGPADLRWIERHLRECETWALVDPLAGWVAGEIVRRHPEASLPVLDRWVTDGDFWVRRSAMLALGRTLGDGRETERLYAYATRLLPEREFFIRKVIGWVLRDEARRNPAEVEAWLRANMARMNLVTLREPCRRFSPALAAELRQAYNTRGDVGQTRR